MYYINKMENKIITETFTNRQNIIIVRFFKFEAKFAVHRLGNGCNCRKLITKCQKNAAPSISAILACFRVKTSECTVLSQARIDIL